MLCKKIILIMFFLLFFVSQGYSFELGDFELNNDFAIFHNDINSPDRLSYFGNWKYKNLFFLKTIYRADYSSDLQDTTFSQFIPTLGVYFYKDIIALVYQYENKRFHTQRSIYSADEDRLGVSFELRRSLWNKKLSWFDDIQVFLYESKSDQRIRWCAKLKYERVFLLNIFYLDMDYSNKDGGVDFSHFWQPTLGYSIYRDKFVDISLRFQFQNQKNQRNIYRFGIGIDF